MANSQSLHALLDQTGWIHALARRLVADPHLAADLAQETCVDALEHEPDTARPLRAWLATVMRNNLAKLYRTDRHRVSREQDARRVELAPAALDVVEKAEIHRNVVLAVLALDEPYRSTLLMRFFEQQSYAEIARRTGVTRAGVNSRVTRGLAELRQRLESTYGGDRRALYLALTPLAKLPTGVAPTLFGVKIMHAAIGTAVATVLAVTASVAWNGGPTRTSASAPPSVTMPPPSRTPATTEEIELRAPIAEERVALVEPTDSPRAVLEPIEFLATPGEQRIQARDADDQVWKAELFRAQSLPPSIESIAVNASRGRIEIAESTSGQLEIKAIVRAQLSSVSKAELVAVFEQHVEVLDDGGKLSIEDKHRDASGWVVSFVVHVPGKLPLSANSGSGDIVVRRAQGPVSANTGSGDVRVELANERVATISGNTGSGNVVAEVLAIEKKLDLNTGSGDVTLRVADVASPGSARLNTGSGDVKLIVPPGINGSFDFETSGDDIVVPPALGIAVQKLDGGKRRAAGSVGGGAGSYKLRSGSGEIEVTLGYALPTKSE